MQYINLEETVFFYFGVNDNAGSGDDGASVVIAIREAGAVASDPPVTATGTKAVLLTDPGYTPGSYEVEIPATAAAGFLANKTYGVFSTILVDSQNPTGLVGIFRTQEVPANVQVIAAGAIDAAAINADAEINLRATGLDLIAVDTFSMPAAMEVIAAAVAGKVSGVGTGTETYVGLDGATDRFVSTIDANGNRTGVTYP